MDFVLPPIKKLIRNTYKNYWSNHQQDKLIEMIFQGFENGVYIDVGAGNGINGNNTLLFKDTYNWKGICIETDPKLFNELKMYRPDDTNINSSNFNINELLKKYNNKIQLLTLNHINQFKILKSISNFNIDVIEFKTNIEGETNDIIHLLNSKGYKLVGRTKNSLIVGHASSLFIDYLNKTKSAPNTKNN